MHLDLSSNAGRSVGIAPAGRRTIVYVLTRAAVLLSVALAASAAAAPAPAHSTRTSWSYAALMQKMDGVTVRLAGRRFRVRSEFVICNGEGRAVRRAGVRRWKHFTCTQTLFRGGLGRDMTWRVHVLGRKRFRISDARWGPL